MKKKTVLIGSAIAAVLVLGGTGVAVAVTEPFDDNDRLTGSTLERASKAALDELGEGKVTDSEADDDGTYDIEVTLDNGREVDVTLDDTFKVLTVDRDDADDDSTGTNGTGTGTDDNDNGTDDNGTDDNGSDDNGTDDAPLTVDERSKAEAAALAVVTGTVTDIDRSDDADRAFEVEVTRVDGTQVDVELDEAFTVVRIDEDGVDDDAIQK